MKKNSLLFSFFFSAILFGQVGIGTTSPNQKAALEVSSSNKGIVAPHVELTTLSDKQTVPNPAEGILVYNTTVDTDQKLVEGYYSWFDNKWNLIGNENYENQIILGELDIQRNLGYLLHPVANSSSVGQNKSIQVNGQPVPYVKVGCKQWELVNNGNGHTYCLYDGDDSLIWSQAFAIAKQEGGYMVTFTTTDEWNWVKSNLIENPTEPTYNWDYNSWIGFNKTTFPGNGLRLRWITGETFRRNWGNNTTTQNYFSPEGGSTQPQPDGATNTGESCGHIFSKEPARTTNRYWNDVDCGATDVDGRSFKRFIIEFNQ